MSTLMHHAGQFVHAHADPWDDERRAQRDADADSGRRPEYEVAAWTHAHPHGLGHTDVDWLDHSRTPDGEMV